MTQHASFVLAGALAAMAATAAAQSAAPASKSQVSYSIPPSLGDGWTTGAAERVGIDVRRLEQMTESIRSHPQDNVHAVLIERDGRLVYEEYFSGKDERRGRPLGVVTFTRDTLHDLRSVTKSVMSALVGSPAPRGPFARSMRRCWTTFPNTPISRCPSDARSPSATPSA